MNQLKFSSHIWNANTPSLFTFMIGTKQLRMVRVREKIAKIGENRKEEEPILSTK